MTKHKSSSPGGSSGKQSSAASPGSHNDASERTPLLPSDREPNANPGESLQDAANQLVDIIDHTQSTKSVWYMILLTISLGGLQMAWSVELSNGTPYLLNLGISKSFMALVWIAGPLSGTVVQPYIGMLSDNCRSSIGKRKPFMLGGAAATIVSLMFLAWAKETVAGIMGIFGADPASKSVVTTTMVLAIIGVYVLDIAINTAQAAIRAYIVDCAPAHQQEAANAMASRVLGSGNILGYIAGYVNLTKIFWFLGHTQFQILCAVASIALALTIGISTIVIPERNPKLEEAPAKSRPNLFVFFGTLFKSIQRLPLQVMRVCQVEFFAWIGFFPLLFYTTSYIGGLYADPILREHPGMSDDELDRLYEEATRVGTFALLINSIVSLGTNVFVPFFVLPTYDKHPVKLNNSLGQTATTEDEEPKGKFEAALEHLQIPGFTLRRAWFGSLIIFFVATICTLMVSSVKVATGLIGLAGVTWAMTLWAPWAIISAEVSRRDTAIRATKLQAAAVAAIEADEPSMLGPIDAAVNGGENLIADIGEEVEDIEDEIDQAGVILGIHNMAIAAPQIIATFASSIIFKIFQKPRDTPGDNSLSIVFALGGICVLVASTFVMRIEESTSTEGNDEDGERGDLFATDGIAQTAFLQSRKSTSSR